MNKKKLLSLIITISFIIVSCESYKKESSFVVKCNQLKTIQGLTTLNGTKFTGSCEVEGDDSGIAIVYAVKSFKKGVPHGVHKRYYYPTNKFDYVGYRKKGHIHGPYTKYYQNGNIMITGQFKKGLYSGEWMFYDEQGKLLEERRHGVDGSEIIGQRKTYSENPIEIE